MNWMLYAQDEVVEIAWLLSELLTSYSLKWMGLKIDEMCLLLLLPIGLISLIKQCSDQVDLISYYKFHYQRQLVIGYQFLKLMYEISL